MSDLRVAAAQFESRNGDKDFNLERINDLSARAAAAGADVMAFRECSITGYSFARRLSKAELLEIAEQVPGGPTVERLIRISRKSEIVILAGLFERGDDGEIYKAQVCVDGTGVLASFRKLHPFINPAIKPGNGYVVFDLRGWKCGILICYDKWWRT